MATLYLNAAKKELGSYTERLRVWLEEAGHGVKELDDFSSGSATVLQQLEDYIFRCDAVLSILGTRSGPDPADRDLEDGDEGEWSYLQRAFLLARDFEVPGPVFLAYRRAERDEENSEPEELRERQEQFLKREISEKGIKGTVFRDGEELIREVQSLAKGWTTESQGEVDGSNPYVGLRPFGAEDRAQFRGRESATKELMDQLEKHGFGVLLGPSGGGKTSLVQAGIVPAWRDRHARGEVISVSAGRDPLRQLALGLRGAGMLETVAEKADQSLAELLRDRGAERVTEPDEETGGEGASKADPSEEIESEKSTAADQAADKDDAPAKADQAENSKDTKDSEKSEPANQKSSKTGASDSPVRPAKSSQAEDRTAPDRVLVLVDDLERALVRERGDTPSGRDVQGLMDLLSLLVETSALPCQLLLLLRDDYFGHLESWPGLARSVDRHLVRLLPPGRQGLRKMVAEPARSRGVQFEDGLTSRLLADQRKNDIQLSRFQHGLRRLWEAEPNLEEGQLRMSTYEEIGGLESALNQDLGQYFQEKTPAEKQILRDLFLGLVEFVPGPAGLRALPRAATRLALIERGGEGSADLLRELVEEKGLLISFGNEEEPVFELAQDAMMTDWDVFAGWVEESRDAVVLGESLREEASIWKKWRKQWRFRRAKAALWRGGRLGRAEELNRVSKGERQSGFARMGGLSERAEEFLNASSRWGRRHSRRSWTLTATSAVVALVAVLVASMAVVQEREASREVRRALSESGKAWLLRSDQAVEMGKDVEAGFLAGVAIGFDGGGKTYPEQLPLGSGLLRWVRERAPERDDTFKKLDEVVAQVPMTATEAKRYLPWANSDPDPFPPLLDKALVPELYARASRRMAEAPRPFLWSSPLGSDVAVIHALAVSPDARSLASAGDDGSVKLWDLESGQQEARFSGGAGAVRSLAFNADARLLVTGNENGSVKLWDVATGREIATLTGHSGPVLSVAFSPDVRKLASGGDDGSVKLWDVATGGAKATLSGHGGPVTVVAFSPGGSLLGSGGSGGFLKLWDVSEEKEQASLCGPGPPVRSLAFSPDGRLLASGEAEGAVRLWTVAQGNQLRILRGRSGGVNDLDFSGDGTQLAGAREDGLVQVWDVERGEELVQFPGHAAAVNGVAFLPGDNLLFSGGGDGTLKLWTTEQKEGFDWFHYAESRWAQLDPVSGDVIWKSHSEGLAYLDQNLPEDSWIGSMRSQEGVAESRALRDFALAAQSWETAVLYQADLDQEAEAPDPSASEVLAHLVRMAWSEGFDGLAELRMEQGDQLFPQQANWALLRGEHLEREGQRDEAVSWYRMVDDPRGWRGVARLSHGEEAMALWQKVLESDRKDIRAEDYRLAGKQAAALGRESESREIYEAGLTHFGGDAGLQVSFGTALNGFGELEMALFYLESGVAALEDAQENRGLLAEALSELAVALGKVGRTEEAWGAYARILGLETGEPYSSSEGVSLELLAGAMYVAMLLGKDASDALFTEAKDRAEGPAERALVMKRRGWGLMAQGRTGEAYSQFGQALAECEFDPTDGAEASSELIAGLAAAGWLSGAKGAALDEYETLWQQQRPGERWEEAAYVEGLKHLPAEAIASLLALREVWHERMHVARENFQDDSSGESGGSP